MTRREPLIHVDNISFEYQVNERTVVPVFDGISLTVREGEYVAIIGHNGCGKSTLIQHFNALLRPQTCRITVDGADLSHPKLDVKGIRRKVGFLFQNIGDHIFEKLVGDDRIFRESGG